MKNPKSIFICIIIAALACFGGLQFNKARGTEKKPQQIPAAVSLTEPFVINLSDTHDESYVKLSIAFSLEPMTEDDLSVFDGTSGQGHGGATTDTPRNHMQTDPVLRDIVITTASKFSSHELLAAGGKEDLKAAILKEIIHRQALEKKKLEELGAEPHQIHIKEVLLTDIAVQ